MHVTFNLLELKCLSWKTAVMLEQNITGGKINEYNVSSAYDIATATYSQSLDVLLRNL